MFGSLTFMGIKVGMGMKVTYDGYVYGHQWLGMGMKVGFSIFKEIIFRYLLQPN